MAKKPKESKEEKRLRKEAAKQEKKEKKGKKAKADKIIVEEEHSLLIPILTALLVIVGIFTLAMAGIIVWSYLNSVSARQPSPQPSPTAERVVISQSAPAARNTGFLLDGE